MRTRNRVELAKLIEACTRLNEISGRLREAMEASGTLVKARYRELQTQWDEAVCAFKEVTDELSARGNQHDDVETRYGWASGAELEIQGLSKRDN
jgi:hypothetical protein